MTHQQAVDTLASERYLLDEMSELERHAFEDHYFSCEACAEHVRVGAVMREGVQAGLGARTEAGTAPEPSSGRGRVLRPAWWTWRPAVLVPWAAAASLAVVVGYQARVMGPASPEAPQPQAVQLITLRPATRGLGPVVPPATAAAAVGFAVDVNEAGAGAELRYNLRDPRGTEVVSDRTTAPEAGTPLGLFVPARLLRVPGEYLLRIRDASGDRLIGEYRFTVASK